MAGLLRINFGFCLTYPLPLCLSSTYTRTQSLWAFGQTEPNRSVPRSFEKFGHQELRTDRSVEKMKTEDFRSRLVRFGLGHDRTNRTRLATIKTIESVANFSSMSRFTYSSSNCSRANFSSMSRFTYSSSNCSSRPAAHNSRVTMTQ
jgi:hypothetical protein